MTANVAHGRFLRFGISIDAALQMVNHGMVVPIQRQNIGQMRRKTIKNRNLAPAAFVHHRHTHAVAESRFAIDHYHIRVFDVGTFADTVIGNVVVNVAHTHIVAYDHVVQPRFVQPRMCRHTAG